MRKYFCILVFIQLIFKLYAYDTFFCTNGPLRIRNGASISSTQISSMRLFDMADIIEKMDTPETIDNITDYWYRIKMNDTEGFVFGGYGIEIKEKYDIKTIDDIIKIFPDKFVKENNSRSVFLGYPNNGLPMVRLDYNITFTDHIFNLEVYFRPKKGADADTLSQRYNLKVHNANNNFGMGSSYQILRGSRGSDEIVSHYGNHGRYFFQDWGSDYTYDIANFLFETDFDDIFNGIIISSFNLWLNDKDNDIRKIDNNFIKEARENKVKDAIIFIIFYELISRISIMN